MNRKNGNQVSIQASLNGGFSILTSNSGLLFKTFWVYLLLWLMVFVPILFAVPANVFQATEEELGSLFQGLSGSQWSIILTVAVIYIAISFWFYGSLARAYFHTAYNKEIVSLSRLFSHFSVGEGLRLYWGIFFAVLVVVMSVVVFTALSGFVGGGIVGSLISFAGIVFVLYLANMFPVFIAYAIENRRYSPFYLGEIKPLLKGNMGVTFLINVIVIVVAFLLSQATLVIIDTGLEFIPLFSEISKAGVLFENTLNVITNWVVTALFFTLSIAHYIELKKSYVTANTPVSTDDQ